MLANSSRVTFSGVTTFFNNSGSPLAFDPDPYVLGGGLLAESSEIQFEGQTNFLNNSAVTQGGGIAAFGGSLNFNGKTAFINNTAGFGGGIIVQFAFYNMDGENTFVGNAGGGIDVQSTTGTLVGNNTFVNNMSPLSEGGGARSTFRSFLTLTGNNTFVNNSAFVGGGLMASYFGTLVAIGENTFIGNYADNGGGAGTFMGGTLNLVGHSTFSRNSVRVAGGGLVAWINTTLMTEGESVFSDNSARYGGGMSILDRGIVHLNGTTKFVRNQAFNGGGVQAWESTLTFAGVSNFTDNVALVGGGLSLSAGSSFFLSTTTTLLFENNTAEQRGGAMHIEDNTFAYCVPITNTFLARFLLYCFFQLDAADIDSRIIFKNNHASLAGSAVYGGSIDNCYLMPQIVDARISTDVFDRITVFEDSNDTVSSISSDAMQVCSCSNGQTDCTISQLSYAKYPGETLSVTLSPVGQREGTVPAVIRAYFEIDSPARFDEFQEAQPANATCTELQYTVFSHNRSENISLFAEGPCGRLGVPLSLNITLLPCPPGFTISETAQGCLCDPRIQKYTNQCDIADGTIHRDGDFWVGLDNSDGVILHPHCPEDYCKTSVISFALVDPNEQCNYNRSGLLCGACQPGLSAVFGSSRCKVCTNSYLSLLLPFALLGIALVVVLFLLKLTATSGTISGLIFYANIVRGLRLNETNPHTIFIAWLNLDLGVETCFYDGMDTYARTWLQFVFPIYIFLLVLIIITLSHFSPWLSRKLGSNPVSVLATLFLLSYAKLLRIIFVSLTFTFLSYPEEREVAVWLYDGNVEYVEGKHIALIVFAAIVFITDFIPYTLLLLFGQWLVRSNLKILSWINKPRLRSFFDAYWAPYKLSHRYWPGLLLIVRFFLFVIALFINILNDPSLNLLLVSASSFALAAWAWMCGGVYKKWYNDVLESSFILNVGLLAIGTFYVRATGGNFKALAYTSISIAFAIFLGILVLHLYWVTKGSHISMLKNIRPNWKAFFMVNHEKGATFYITEKEVTTSEIEISSDAMALQSRPESASLFVALREPLLEDTA